MYPPANIFNQKIGTLSKGAVLVCRQNHTPIAKLGARSRDRVLWYFKGKSFVWQGFFLSGERCSPFLTDLPLCLRDGVVCTRPRRRGVPIGAQAVVDGTDPEGRTALHVACGLPDPPRIPQYRGGRGFGAGGGHPQGLGHLRGGGGVGSGGMQEGASVGGACQGNGGAPGFCSSGSEAHGNIGTRLVFKVGPSPRVESPPPGSIWVRPNSGEKIGFFAG